MENHKFCPIEEALLRIEGSANTSRDLVNTLYFLERIISKFLSQPNDWRFRNFKKENELLIQKLMGWEEARQFLNMIGFNDDIVYEHTVCDENMKFLEATLTSITNHIRNLKSAFVEEKPSYKAMEIDSDLRKSRGSTSSDVPFEKSQKNRGSKLKDMLSRHLKQDQVDSRVSGSDWKRRESVGASLNAEGHFYQTCEKKDIKKRKCFFAEMFDKHDLNCKQKGSSFFTILKSG